MGKYIIAPPSGSQINALGAKDRPWEEVHANRYPGINEYLAESTGYGIVSGCEPSINGLTVTVGAGVIHTYDGRRIEVPEQSITLDVADATKPRTDVVYLDTNGAIAKITGDLGTAAASSAPALTESVIKVGEIAIKAGATSGTLTTTYNHYKTATITYRNVETMRQDRTLMLGMAVHTLGYYTANDGGGAMYIIRSKKDTDTDNGGSIIVLDNRNVAELIVDGAVNVKQFGAKGDGSADASAALQAAIDASNHVIIPTGTYNITQTLTISKNLQLEGESTGSVIQLTASADINLVELTGGSYHEFANITFTRSTKDTSAGIGISTTNGGWNAKLTNCTFNYFRIGVLLHSATGVSINKCYFTVLGYGVLFESQTPKSYDTTTLIDIRYSTFQYCNPALKVENAQGTYPQLLNLLCLSCDFEANTQSLAFKNYSYNYTFINCWFENNTNAPDVSGGTWIGTMFQGTTDSDVIKPNATTLIGNGGNEQGIKTKNIYFNNGTVFGSTDTGVLCAYGCPCIPFFISYNPGNTNISSNLSKYVNVEITKIETGKYIFTLKKTSGTSLNSVGWLKAISMIAFAYNYKPPTTKSDGTPNFDAIKTNHYTIDVYGANQADVGSYWSFNCAVDTLYVATYSDTARTTPVDCGFTVLLFGYT